MEVVQVYTSNSKMLAAKTLSSFRSMSQLYGQLRLSSEFFAPKRLFEARKVEVVLVLPQPLPI